jgi:hypothetical protein
MPSIFVELNEDNFGRLSDNIEIGDLNMEIEAVYTFFGKWDKGDRDTQGGYCDTSDTLDVESLKVLKFGDEVAITDNQAKELTGIIKNNIEN